jgi:hypothetical protein
MKKKSALRYGNRRLASSNRADDQERLSSGCDCIRQRSVRGLVRQIFLTSEEAEKRPPLLRALVSNGAAEHRILRLKRVQHRALRNHARDLKRDFGSGVSQRSKVEWENYADHFVDSVRASRQI